MTKGKATILGINGHVGHHAAKAFVAAGWEVTGFGRSNRHPVDGVRFVAGDATNLSDLKRAVGDSDVVVNALNLPYPDWDKGRYEALTATVIEALGTSRRTLLFPGNIYGYATNDRVLTPDLPQEPPTPRGEIRKRIETMYRVAAERGDVQVLILRAGDFFGPESRGDWFDLAVLREAHKGKAAVLGAKGVGHAWAYLPDMGRAFEVLAGRRDELAAFENFHFAGHFVTPEQMAAALVAAAPVPLKVSHFPWVLMTLMGLASPLMREVAKMGYLWQHPMALSDPRLDALLGAGFGTPFDEAVAATIEPFFAKRVEQAA